MFNAACDGHQTKKDALVLRCNFRPSTGEYCPRDRLRVVKKVLYLVVKISINTLIFNPGYPYGKKTRLRTDKYCLENMLVDKSK